MPSANCFDVDFEFSYPEDQAEKMELEISEITEEDFDSKERNHVAFFSNFKYQ